MSLPPDEDEEFTVSRRTSRPQTPSSEGSEGRVSSLPTRLPVARPTNQPPHTSWLQEVRDTPIPGEADFIPLGHEAGLENEEDEDLFPNIAGGKRKLPIPGSKEQLRARNQYKSTITSELMFNTKYSRWEKLEERVAVLTATIQGILSEQNMAEEIRHARVDRGEDRDATLKKLESFVLRALQGDNSLGEDKYYIVSRVINEIVGLGPLEPLWEDDSITEIIVQGHKKVLAETNGKLRIVPGIRFRNADHLRDLAKQILAPLNRSIDVTNSLENGRLAGLSRVHIVHESLSPLGYIITIRRHKERPWTLENLVENNVLTAEMAADLGHWIYSGLSTAVVGGTGSGKALSVDTLIPTPHGFVRLGDLAIGDEVLGSNGQAIKIKGIYDQGKKKAYRVVFSDGTVVIADKDHNWLTYTRSARRAKSRAATNPRKTPINMDEYCLLRDLLKKKAEEEKLITLRDLQNVVPSASSLLWRLSYSVSPQRKGQYGRKYFDPSDLSDLLDKKFNDFKIGQDAEFGAVVTTQEIKDTLLTNTNHRNHAVPTLSAPVHWETQLTLSSGILNDFNQVAPELVYTDVETRETYLAGIVDAKAEVNGDWVTFKTEDFDPTDLATLTTLIESLGIIVNQREGVAITYVMANPVSERNLARSQFRYIVEVEELDEEVEMRCLSVAAKDSLFLCGTHFIPTHNTTVLNALSGLFPEHDNIITIEDNLELQLHPERFVTPLEAREANASGKGAVSIRTLVKASLRMRPDRIVVGEVRDSAAYDMLQAMNTGHNGSMTTLHANGSDESIQRLGDMAGMSGEITPEGVKFLISSSLDLLVVAKKYDEDGSRRLEGIYEVPNRVVRGENGTLELLPIPLWEFVYESTDEDGKVIGRYEKKNEMSASMERKYSLASRPRMTLEEIYALSALEDDTADTD